MRLWNKSSVGDGSPVGIGKAPAPRPCLHRLESESTLQRVSWEERGAGFRLPKTQSNMHPPPAGHAAHRDPCQSIPLLVFTRILPFSRRPYFPWMWDPRDVAARRRASTLPRRCAPPSQPSYYSGRLPPQSRCPASTGTPCDAPSSASAPSARPPPVFFASRRTRPVLPLGLASITGGNVISNHLCLLVRPACTV